MAQSSDVAEAAAPDAAEAVTPDAVTPDAVTPDLERTKFRLVLGIGVASMLLGLVVGFGVEGPAEFWRGTVTILVSPSALLTDFLYTGGVGATFFNAGLLMVASLAVVHTQKVTISGPLLAGFFTVFGFAFFGKNLFNTIPVMLGVLLYARLEKKSFYRYLTAALFATALAPTVSHIAFGIGLSPWLGVPLSYVVGLLMGLLVPPLAAQFIKFHHGLSLYNVGFTAGMVGMFVVALLNLIGVDAVKVSLLSTGNDVAVVVFVLGSCAALFATGFALSGASVRGIWSLMHAHGRTPGDFVARAGLGDTLMNMGVVGALATVLVLVLGGDLNGPIVGGIYTIVGFGAFGKHALNVVPIWVGVALGSLLRGDELGTTAVLLTMLFGTTIAPISSVFGPIAGVTAGLVHTALVTNVGPLHGGLNLYNHGFGAGLVAIMLIPIFNAILRIAGKPERSVDL